MTKISSFIFQLRYSISALTLIIFRALLEFLMWANEIILVGIADEFLFKYSAFYNSRLIRFQLEQIDKGMITGLQVIDFQLAQGCWIATVALAKEIQNDARATAFVTDIVAYSTHTPKKNIMTSFLNPSQIKIVVSDYRIE